MAPEEEKGGTRPSGLWDVLFKGLVALAGGVTLGGLVAVAGGMILWFRFDSAGLPGETSVSVVARHELVAAGLTNMIPFLIAAAIALALMYLVDPDATVPSGPDEAGAWRSFRTGARAVWKRAATLVVIEFVFLALGFAWTADRIRVDPAVVVPALVVALAGALLSLTVAARTTGFRWFAVAAFFSIFLFGVTVNFAETQRRPLVRPAAVLLDDGRAFAGVYVTQNEDRIYLGSLRPKQRCPADVTEGKEIKGKTTSGYVRSFRRTEVETLVVGRLKSVCESLARAPRLADELLKRPKPAKPKPAPAPK